MIGTTETTYKLDLRESEDEKKRIPLRIFLQQRLLTSTEIEAAPKWR